MVTESHRPGQAPPMRYSGRADMQQHHIIHSDDGRPSSWTGPAASAIVAVLLVLVVLPALIRPAEFFQDDSYFYLQVARNIVDGLGSTFHGITPTNGYHPLWMAGAVAAMFLADGDKIAALHLVVLMQAAMALGVALLFNRLARAMGLEHGLVGIAVILSYLLGTSLYGSEAHLNALTLVAGIAALWHALANDRPRDWFATGLLCGLAILARLDNVFVVAGLCGLGVMHDHERSLARITRRATAAGLGGAIVVAPYLACNWLQYGHLMPISGAIKSTFPAFDFDFDRLGAMGKLATPFGVLALIIGLFLDRDRRRRVVWCGLGAGVVAHALYVVGFTDHYTFWAWYYVSGVLAAGFSAAYLPGWLAHRPGAARIGSSLRPLVFALTLLMLLGGAARAWLKAFNPIRVGAVTVNVPINEYRWPEEFALWMKAHLPPGSIVFVYDWPGATAYYSDLRILPRDGLMSDFRYNDELLALGPTRYLCAHDVKFFLGLIDDDAATREVVVDAPLYRRAAGTLSLREDALVVKTRDVVSRPGEALPFAIWRIECPTS